MGAICGREINVLWHDFTVIMIFHGIIGMWGYVGLCGLDAIYRVWGLHMDYQGVNIMWDNFYTLFVYGMFSNKDHSVIKFIWSSKDL